MTHLKIFLKIIEKGQLNVEAKFKSFIILDTERDIKKKKYKTRNTQPFGMEF